MPKWVVFDSPLVKSAFPGHQVAEVLLDYSDLRITVNIPRTAAGTASARVARRHFEARQVSYDKIFIPPDDVKK